MSTHRPNADAGLDRLRDVLDAYGAGPERWPAPERDALAALLGHSAEARRLHEEAARLDAALDALPAAMPSAGLEERIVAAGLAATTAVEDMPRIRPISSIGAAPARRAARARRTPRWLAAALPLAAAAAVAAWLATGPRTEPPTQVATLPLATAPRAATTVGTEPFDGDPLMAVDEIALAELGVYETPGDALLGASGFGDVYAAAPWDGCVAGELGCLDVDTLPLEPVSRDENGPQEARLIA